MPKDILDHFEEPPKPSFFNKLLDKVLELLDKLLGAKNAVKVMAVFVVAIIIFTIAEWQDSTPFEVRKTAFACLGMIVFFFMGGLVTVFIWRGLGHLIKFLTGRYNSLMETDSLSAAFFFSLLMLLGIVIATFS